MSRDYDFAVEDSESIFQTLLQNEKIKLPTCKGLEEEERTNDPKYCIYHMVISHHIKDCWVFKNKVHDLLDNGVITLEKEDKKVTTNMISIHFGSFEKPTEILSSIEEENVEFRLVNSIKDKDGLVPTEMPDRTIMWVYPDLMTDEG